MVIAKRLPEAKICTLWIAPPARGRGLARELLAEAMDWLGTTKPLMSIPTELLTDCRGFLEHFGFRLEQQLPNYYREGSSEFVFNGQLPQRAPRFAAPTPELALEGPAP